MKIVCLGDSITAGLGKKKEHWIEILKNETAVSYINKGICGDTSGGMLTRFYRDVVEEKPASVIIMGGFNDFIAGSEEGGVRANFMAMVHQAWFHRIFPVVGIPPLFDLPSVRSDWAGFTDFNRVLECCTRQRVWLYQFAKLFRADVIDFEQAFLQQAEGNRAGYFSDGIHPNTKGNRIMAEWILSRL